MLVVPIHVLVSNICWHGRYPFDVALGCNHKLNEVLRIGGKISSPRAFISCSQKQGLFFVGWLLNVPAA